VDLGIGWHCGCMFWRLALSAFALWWGYNAIQMFSCESVSWSGGTAYCSDVSGSGAISGSAMGGIILVAVAGVLFWLWVWPFMRLQKASQIATAHALRLSAVTGIPAETIYRQMRDGNLTPGEWAVAHGLDPYTFTPKE